MYREMLRCETRAKFIPALCAKQSLAPSATPMCNFEYAGWLTEANHLGNVAYRVGKKLEWDAKKLRAKNAPEAEPLIHRKYRKGWKLI
jgi:hypothetical protein